MSTERQPRAVYAFGCVPLDDDPEALETILARVSNGPYTLLVAGETYEQIIELAESWVENQEGHRFTPTTYVDLAAARVRGVIGVLDEEHGDALEDPGE